MEAGGEDGVRAQPEHPAAQGLGVGEAAALDVDQVRRVPEPAGPPFQHLLPRAQVDGVGEVEVDEGLLHAHQRGPASRREEGGRALRDRGHVVEAQVQEGLEAAQQADVEQEIAGDPAGEGVFAGAGQGVGAAGLQEPRKPHPLPLDGQGRVFRLGGPRRRLHLRGAEEVVLLARAGVCTAGVRRLRPRLRLRVERRAPQAGGQQARQQLFPHAGHPTCSGFPGRTCRTCSRPPCRTRCR